MVAKNANAMNLNAVAGVLVWDGTSALSTISNINNGVYITSATGVPELLANGTATYVLTANTGAPPSWQAAGAGSAGTITGDSGGALSQSAGNWNILGTAAEVTTTGSGATLTLSLPSAITAPGSLTTTTTLTSGTLFKASEGQIVNRTATAISYSVLTTDYIVAVTSTSAARTITFPTTPAVGQVWIVKDESGAASINNIELYAGGTTTIDGLTAQYLNTNYGAVTIYAGTTSAYFIV